MSYEGYTILTMLGRGYKSCMHTVASDIAWLVRSLLFFKNFEKPRVVALLTRRIMGVLKHKQSILNHLLGLLKTSHLIVEIT